MVHLLQLDCVLMEISIWQIFKILSIREHGSQKYLFLLCCSLGSARLLPVVRFVLLQSLVLPVPSMYRSGCAVRGELRSCPFAACSTKPSSGRLPWFAGIPQSDRWNSVTQGVICYLFKQPFYLEYVFSDLTGARSSTLRWRLKMCTRGEGAGYVLPLSFWL